MTVGEITENLESSLANVSHHLGVLYDAELVSRKRKGRNILYALNPQVFTRGKQDVLNFGCCKVVLRGK